MSGCQINIRVFVVFFHFFFFFSIAHAQNSFNSLSFQNPPANSKIHIWWHWVDGNITKEGITKDLEAMKEQGIVQATILNVGLFDNKDFGVAKIKFDSDKWHEMFRWSLQEANRLGITIGAHNCDGWSTSGGPWITPEQSMKQFVFTKTNVEGGKRISVKLRKPFAVRDFYKDVAVVAYQTNESQNLFRNSAPVIRLNNISDASVLMDGDPVSAVKLDKGDFLLVSSDTIMTFDNLAIYPRKPFTWLNTEEYISKYAITFSQDGKEFKKLLDAKVTGINKMSNISVPKTSARFVKVTIEELNDNNGLPFTISELELLNGNELASFSPNVPQISEKTVSVKINRENYLYEAAPVSTPAIQSKQVINLSGKMLADGSLNWDLPAGNWTILRFGFTSTGMLNVPATNEGTGLECDKMDSSAVNLHFNSFTQKLISNAGIYVGNTFKFILIDSWEAAFQNWTDRFPEEFQNRRGYNILDFIPLLCGNVMNSPEESEGVLFDFRKTIAELIESRYFNQFVKLSHRQGLELHAEVIYGGSNYPPIDILKTNSSSDLIMGEFWAGGYSRSFNDFVPSAPEIQLTSSAVTGYDKSLNAAEAYTGMAHYSESPAYLKPFGDQMYCSGINQFILHSYVHQPTDQKPGLTLGEFGSHFNRNNLTWPYLSDWLTYQSRIQYILQQGSATPDVLYYLGDQLPQFCNNSSTNTLPFGYLQTVINFDILKNRLKIENGKLRMNNKGSYSLLCLPVFQYMNFETLKIINELVEQGAIIYGPKPLSQLNLNDIKQNKSAFQLLSDKLWGNIDGQKEFQNNVGKGKVIWGIPLAEVLKLIKLSPDFSTDQVENNTFRFIHKTIGGTDVFFVANQLDSEVKRNCFFRIEGKTPTVWMPLDGTISNPANYFQDKGQIRIPVVFKPHESKFFIFEPGRNKSAGRPAGIPEEVVVSNLNGTIQFEPAYQAKIEPVNISSLKSLTDFENPEIRYFAGTATYLLSFDVPDSFNTAKDSLLLNIGSFSAVAEVWLNNKLVGKLWNPYTNQNITGLLKNKNELVVKVANAYRNRFIGDFIQYGKVQSLWTSSPIDSFLDKEKPLFPAGLMGPIKVIKYKTNH